MEIKKPNELSLFQRWVILYFHKNQGGKIVDAWLIQNCCITALTENFTKSAALDDLKELETMQLIRLMPKGETGHEQGFGRIYSSSMDGVIYAKKMLMPILEGMDRQDFMRKVTSLGETKTSAIFNQIYSRYNQNSQQPEALDNLTNVGLSNIGKFSKVWKLFSA